MRDEKAYRTIWMKERSAIYHGILCGLGYLGSLLLPVGLWGQTPSVRSSLDSTELRAKAKEYYFQAVLAYQAAKPLVAFDLLRHAQTLAPMDPEVTYLLGKTYADLGRSDEALTYLRRAYDLDSTNNAFAQALSTAYIQAERMQDALVLNERLLASDPEDDDLRYRLVQLYARTGDMKQAVRRAGELQQKFRSQPEAYGQITRLKIHLLTFAKDKSAVEAEYRAWADLYPEDRGPYYDWILYLLQDGQVEQAEKRLRQDLASRRITAGDASALRVHKYLLGKDYAAAEAELLRLNAEEKIEANEKLTLWLLLTKEAQGSEGYTADKYLSGIRQLVERYPNDLDVLKGYAQVLRYGEHYQEAFDLLYPQTKLHPDVAWLWTELFDDAIGLSSDSLLQRVAQESLPHLPTDWRSYVVLAGDLFQREEYQKAIDLLERGALAIDPKKGFGAARLYGLLADIYAERGGPSKTARADSLYQLAIDANPQDADVLNNYAYRLAKRGEELDMAEQYAGQAIKLSPEAAHILDTYAYILLLRKNYTLAKLYQRRALEQAGDKASVDMYDHLGDIYLGTGELDAALEAWQTALKLDTEHKLDEQALRRKIHDVQKRLKKK